MNKLTLQDYIELEVLIKNDTGDFEKQCFLLSRYYELSEEHIKRIDIRLINLMINDMQIHVDKKKISKEEINDEIENIQNNINKDHKEGKHDSIEDRFGILDL